MGPYALIFPLALLAGPSFSPREKGSRPRPTPPRRSHAEPPFEALTASGKDGMRLLSDKDLDDATSRLRDKNLRAAADAAHLLRA